MVKTVIDWLAGAWTDTRNHLWSISADSQCRGDKAPHLLHRLYQMLVCRPGVTCPGPVPPIHEYFAHYEARGKLRQTVNRP